MGSVKTTDTSVSSSAGSLDPGVETVFTLAYETWNPPMRQLLGHVNERLAPVMFYLSFAFLTLTAALLVVWIDVARVVETVEGAGVANATTDSIQLISEQDIYFESTAVRLGYYCIVGLLMLWPFFIAEQIYYFTASDGIKDFRNHHPFWYSICLVPPLRICARNRHKDGKIWFPVLGWQIPNRFLQRQLERLTSVPMVCIALLILPVLGLQFLFGDNISSYPLLRIILHIGTGVIWLAFATEFILMVSVADNKVRYCKKHWLDLVIILLPLISFLRTLQLLRASKMAKLGKVQYLTKMVRVYRLRGVSMRALRAILVLEVVHRLLRISPQNRIENMESQYKEKLLELELLRHEIDELKAKYGQPTVSSVAIAVGDPQRVAD